MSALPPEAMYHRKTTVMARSWLRGSSDTSLSNVYPLLEVPFPTGKTACMGGVSV